MPDQPANHGCDGCQNGRSRWQQSINAMIARSNQRPGLFRDKKLILVRHMYIDDPQDDQDDHDQSFLSSGPRFSRTSF